MADTTATSNQPSTAVTALYYNSRYSAEELVATSKLAKHEELSHRNAFVPVAIENLAKQL